MVFAAASLKDALDEVNAAYRRNLGRATTTSYAASSSLAKQIEAAAPADIFISADLDWMDYLAKKNLIKAETRANRLGNQLGLIAPSGSTIELGIAPNFPLAQALGNGRLAVADPNGVPAGKYGKASLQALGVWSSVADKLAPAENVRAALLLVSPLWRVRPIPGIPAISPISGRRQRALSSRSTGSRSSNEAMPEEIRVIAPMAEWLHLSPEEATAVHLSSRVPLWAMTASLIPGVLVALVLARGRFWGKALLDGEVHLPPVVTGYLLLLLGRRGPLGQALR